MPIETGDTVKHIPTGETWIVACVEGNDLSWCGWPEGMARLSDCELVEKATVQRRQELLESLAAMGQDDHRARYAKRLLNAPACKTCGSAKVDENGRLLHWATCPEGSKPACKTCGDTKVVTKWKQRDKGTLRTSLDATIGPCPDCAKES